MLRAWAVTVLLSVAATACATQRGEVPRSLAEGRELAQPVGEMRMSGVGDAIVTLTRRREGPLRSGGGDIRGGTGGGAVAVVTYRGLRDGQAVLERRDMVVYRPEGMPPTLLDGGGSEILLDPAALPQTLVVDGIYLRVVEADRFIIRYLLSRNRL